MNHCFCFDFREEEPNLINYDVFTVAAVLKKYLRDLPDHIFTKELFPKFEEAAAKPKGEKIEVCSLFSMTSVVVSYSVLY